MAADTYTIVAGIRATCCEVTNAHRPVPLRFIWHHIQPQVCGGKTEPANLIQLCDSCHYTIHTLLWSMRTTGGLTPMRGTRKQRAIAKDGYDRCLAANTTDKIPHE